MSPDKRITQPRARGGVPFTSVPVVDLGRWFAAQTDRERRDAARDVYDACASAGFMYVVGHAVAPGLIAEVFAQGRAFFALPAERKAQIDFRQANRYRGYVPLQAESSDPLAAPDRKEAFDFGLAIDTVPATTSIGARLRSPNQWPQDLPGFRPALEAYFSEMRRLAHTLFAIVAVAFRLPPAYFEAKIDKPIAQMRVLHYPSRPPNAGDFGIGAHCDYECFTILAQDEVGGLQLKNEAGAWIEVPSIENAFVINIGEMLARWTNDVFAATEHRVINRSGRERYSIPFFFATNPDVIITPIVEPGSSETPHYEPISAGAYLASRLDEVYGIPATAK